MNILISLEKFLKYKRRPKAPLPPPVTQSATVYPPSQSCDQGVNSHTMGTTRQDINTHHLTYQVNNLTNLINPSVQDLNFSNSLRPLLGPTSKLVQIEVHQHHHPHLYPLMLLHPQNSPQIFLGSEIFRVVVIQMLDLLCKRNHHKNQKAFR